MGMPGTPGRGHARLGGWLAGLAGWVEVESRLLNGGD